MRLYGPLLAALLAACGGRADEEPGVPGPHAVAEPATTSDTPPTPTGARPLSPDEPTIPRQGASTGGGPGSPSVSGVARAAQPLLLECWMAEVRGGHAPARVSGSLHVAAAPDGTVTSATATLATGRSDALVTCLERTGRRLRFPPAATGNEYELPLSFDLPR